MQTTRNFCCSLRLTKGQESRIWGKRFCHMPKDCMPTAQTELPKEAEHLGAYFVQTESCQLFLS